MSNSKKLLQAAAGSAGGAGGLNVEDVFSTYLYEGNGESQSIDNGINLGQSNDGGSAHFKPDDSNDTDEISLASANYITSGDFTIECFVWIEGLNSTNTSGYEIPTIFYFNSPRLSLTYDFVSPGSSADQAFNLFDTTYRFGSINQHPEATYTNTWVHVAVVRNSGTIRCYVDGTEAFNFSNTTDYSGATLTIGNNSNGTPVQGHISNFRVVDGTAVYTSSFTPPTSELTAVSGTTLLTFTSENTLTDTSSNSHAFTITGSVSASTFGPFDAADAGEGGLVWIKNRDSSTNHMLQDSERGTNFIFSDLTNAQVDYTTNAHTFNSNGFTINGSAIQFNQSGSSHASWTFRKAPKFFDVVTYTGDGTSSQQITHNLGVTPGLIIVKAASSVGSNANWLVWHRSLTQSAGYLNSSQAFGGGEYTYSFNQPSDTYIDVKKVGSIASGTNDSGITYVAYLFAHNDGDGEFGPDGDADIIKCGSYTGTGSAGTFVDLGFEPQWLLIKRSTGNNSWTIFDVMRGMTAGGSDSYVWPDLSNAESSFSSILTPTPTGFQLDGNSLNTNTDTYIYIAIRRGPMAVPESADEVFDLYYNSTSGKTNGVYGNIGPVDIIYSKRLNTAAGPYLFDRLRGGSQLLTTSATNAESTRSPAWHQFDVMVGVQEDYATVYTPGFANTGIDAFWKRAPNFCDVVAYTGNGTAGRTVSHNLGVAPEMIWVKRRDATASWITLLPTGDYALLNTTDAAFTTTENAFGDNSVYIPPTATEFTLASSTAVNGSGGTYVAYLFASLDGVSKVGSYTGNGSTQTIDCGFSSGARFVLIKRTDSTGDWYVWDTERGIVAGNDPHYRLNEDAAEVTTDDSLDPDNSGFIVNQVSATNINVSSASYIFYAIA